MLGILLFVRMSVQGRQQALAPHKSTVRFLEGTRNLAEFSAFYLVVFNTDHIPDDQISD